MKKLSRYKLNQGINYFKNKIDTGRPLKWIYIMDITEEALHIQLNNI